MQHPHGHTESIPRERLAIDTGRQESEINAGWGVKDGRRHGNSLQVTRSWQSRLNDFHQINTFRPVPKNKLGGKQTKQKHTKKARSLFFGFSFPPFRDVNINLFLVHGQNQRQTWNEKRILLWGVFEVEVERCGRRVEPHSGNPDLGGSVGGAGGGSQDMRGGCRMAEARHLSARDEPTLSHLTGAYLKSQGSPLTLKSPLNDCYTPNWVLHRKPQL